MANSESEARGYRVAIDEANPLDVDPGNAATQRHKQMVFLHGIMTLLSMGLWIPVLLFWLLFGLSRSRAFAAKYRVRLRAGRIEAGNDTDVRSIGLESITDVRIKKGWVTITARGVQPLVLFGLKDPRAAADAIFAARDELIRSLGAPQRAFVEAAEVEVAAGANAASLRAGGHG